MINRLPYAALAAVLVAAIRTSALASERVDCFYAARATKDHSAGITLHRRCATIERDGTLRVLPGHLRALDFDSNGLATLAIGKDRWFYVKRDGRSLEVLPFDNGADYFAEGLVRGRRNGKIAFFNRSFRMVIPPTYDFAWPFEDGLAEVCSGCVEASDGEHHTLTGGLWRYIDRRQRGLAFVDEVLIDRQLEKSAGSGLRRNVGHIRLLYGFIVDFIGGFHWGFR